MWVFVCNLFNVIMEILERKYRRIEASGISKLEKSIRNRIREEEESVFAIPHSSQNCGVLFLRLRRRAQLERDTKLSLARRNLARCCDVQQHEDRRFFAEPHLASLLGVNCVEYRKCRPREKRVVPYGVMLALFWVAVALGCFLEALGGSFGALCDARTKVATMFSLLFLYSP